MKRKLNWKLIIAHVFVNALAIGCLWLVPGINLVHPTSPLISLAIRHCILRTTQRVRETDHPIHHVAIPLRFIWSGGDFDQHAVVGCWNA